MMLWGMADHASWLQDRYPRDDGLQKRPLPVRRGAAREAAARRDRRCDSRDAGANRR